MSVGDDVITPWKLLFNQEALSCMDGFFFLLSRLDIVRSIWFGISCEVVSRKLQLFHAAAIFRVYWFKFIYFTL